MRMIYRDNMTAAETAQLLAECDALDAMYADAHAQYLASLAGSPDPSEEEIEAEYEQSMDHLNKIAGDR